jgi:hypothetical protein
VANSWKALHLFGGADPVTLGTNFKDLDYKAVQGAGETRIASRARVPAAVLGISEGLQGSALNAGNFGQARRQFGEQFAYPSWRQMCEALSSLVAVPAGSELWYDTKDVAFLHEDAKDAAAVLSTDATSIRTLTDGGYSSESVIAAVTGGDLSLLKHTGLVPVQLQQPGAETDPSVAAQETAETIQKIYLGVINGVLTVDEARKIINETGAALPIPGPGELQPQPPTPDSENSMPTINVDARTNIDMAEVRFDQAAPQIHVDAPPPAEVVVNVEAQPPPEVVVNVPEQRPTKRTVERDDKGNIIAVTEERIEMNERHG